jgi:hypothetical protein
VKALQESSTVECPVVSANSIAMNCRWAKPTVMTQRPPTERAAHAVFMLTASGAWRLHSETIE